MTTAHEVLAIAASQIGQREHPPGSNHTKYNRWYYGNDTAASWCYTGLSWVFHKADALDLVHGRHAYVPACRGIFEPHGQWHTSHPQEGDLVCFDFNRTGSPEHIEIVERVISGSHLQTIGFNTSNRVARRRRWRGYVYGYARPAYGEDDDMQLSDNVPLNSWIKKSHPHDEGIRDGIHVSTALGSGYGHARAAHDASTACLAELRAQRATIDKLVDAVAHGPGVDLDELKREIREAIESVTVRLDVSDEE